MIELVAQSPVLRTLLLILLFSLVALAAYFSAQSFAIRQLTLRRLMGGVSAVPSTQTFGSLRAERVESAWLKLVNSIERRGLSLVDTKDETLRRKLIAAGYEATFAPRVYTLIRLVLVVSLPLLVLRFSGLPVQAPA